MSPPSPASYALARSQHVSRSSSLACSHATELSQRYKPFKTGWRLLLHQRQLSRATLIPRSYLYVPGDQPHKLERATRSGADAVIADLEDAVTPSAKTAARNFLADWLATLTDTNRPEIWVRVNASPLMAEDVSIVIGPPLAGLCLPKVGRPEQILSLDDLVTAGEQRGGSPQVRSASFRCLSRPQASCRPRL